MLSEQPPSRRSLLYPSSTCVFQSIRPPLTRCFEAHVLVSVDRRFVNGLGFGLSHGLAVEIEAISVVNNPVQDGVSESRVAPSTPTDKTIDSFSPAFRRRRRPIPKISPRITPPNIRHVVMHVSWNIRDKHGRRSQSGAYAHSSRNA